MYSLSIEGEEGGWKGPGWDVLFDYEGEGSAAVNKKPVYGVCLVFDSPKGGDPFILCVVIEGLDAVAKKSIGVGVDHIVLHGQQVDHASIFIISDHQIGDEHHLVVVQRTTVNLIGP